MRREPNLSENDYKHLYLCETPPRVAQLSIELQTCGEIIVSLETALSENEWYKENCVSKMSLVEDLEIFTISEDLLNEYWRNYPHQLLR